MRNVVEDTIIIELAAAAINTEHRSQSSSAFKREKLLRTITIKYLKKKRHMELCYGSGQMTEVETPGQFLFVKNL